MCDVQTQLFILLNSRFDLGIVGEPLLYIVLVKKHWSLLLSNNLWPVPVLIHKNMHYMAHSTES